MLVLVMICLGASVTTMRAGDSDPEWSLFGIISWFRDAQAGLAVELNHRKFGLLLGLVGLILVYRIWRKERRAWVRRSAYATMLLLLLQGVLGGVRVLVISDPAWFESLQPFFGGASAYDVSMRIAMLHGSLAQALFCIYVILAVVSSKAWMLGEYPISRSAASRGTKLLLVATSIALFVQLVLGTYVRHSEGKGVPLHIVGACVATGLLLWLAKRAKSKHPEAFPVWHLGGLLRFLLFLQIFLGLVSWAVIQKSNYALPGDVAFLVRVGHLANGAMMLAICITATIRGFKTLEPSLGNSASVPVANGEARA